jgi:hypothetical protein
MVHSTNNVVDGFLPAYIEYQSLCGTFSERLLGTISRIGTLSGWLAKKTLVCTSPWGFQSKFLSSPNSTEAFMENALYSVEETAINNKLQFCAFPYVSELSSILRKCLLRAGYHEFPNCPTTRLDLKFNSFEQYVNQLESGDFRSMIRRERKKNDHMKYVWFEDDSLYTKMDGVPLHEILMNLHNKTWKKYNRRVSPLNPFFIAEIWEQERANMRLCLAMKGPRVTAFNFLRLDANDAHIFMVGKDDRLTRHYSTYFNVVFYETIIRGIQEGWRTIFFRPGTYRAKHRRGCLTEHLFLYVKSFNPMMNKILAVYTALARDHFLNKYMPPRLYNY